MKLVVVQPFAGHSLGDEITDSDEVAAVLAGENALHVVQVTYDPTARPAKETK